MHLHKGAPVPTNEQSRFFSFDGLVRRGAAELACRERLWACSALSLAWSASLSLQKTPHLAAFDSPPHSSWRTFLIWSG